MGGIVKCKKHDWYIEEYPEYHNEELGAYVVMCYECGVGDKYVYYDYVSADKRLQELEKSSS